MSAWTVPGYAEEYKLGKGATGRVVAAVYLDTGFPVAIKYLAPALYNDRDFLDALRREAGLLRQVDMPQVVMVYDYAEEPGQGAAIVMERVDGISLHEMIARQGPTTPEAALVLLKGSLLGLAAAHQMGIVHRDYKPENVIVDREGRAKLTDFGVAVRAGKTAPAAGTPLYMAPEQWAGGPASPQSDIYAAAAVFLECLTGEPPFRGTMAELAAQHERGEVPSRLADPAVRGLVGRGMAKDPWDRPPGALDFLDQLTWVAGREYGPDWEERGRSHLAARAAALLLLMHGDASGAGSGRAAADGWFSRVGRGHKAALGAVALSAVLAMAAGGTAYALLGNSTTNGPAPVTSTPSDPVPSASGGPVSHGPHHTVQPHPVGTSAQPTPSTLPGTQPAGSVPAPAPALSPASPGSTPAQTPTARPPATVPPTTAPPTTQPPTTQPPTTQPPTTAPPTTAPPTTAPPTTQPPTSAPATTDPSTTAPATTTVQ
jgi:serine/threonine-protein kinase